MMKLNAINWIARYKDGTTRHTDYNGIDRKRLASISLYDDGELVHTVNSKHAIYRKRTFINGGGNHIATVYIIGEREGVFVVYYPETKELCAVEDPDIELTENELL